MRNPRDLLPGLEVIYRSVPLLQWSWNGAGSSVSWLDIRHYTVLDNRRVTILIVPSSAVMHSALKRDGNAELDAMALRRQALDERSLILKLLAQGGQLAGKAGLVNRLGASSF